MPTKKFEGGELGEGQGEGRFEPSQKALGEEVLREAPRVSNFEGVIKFLHDKFSGWGSSHNNRNPVSVMPIEIQDINLQTLAQTPDAFSRVPTVTLDPRLEFIDFEKMQVDIASDEFQSTQTYKAIEEYLEKFKDSHYFPGIEYAKWLSEDFERVPKELRDGRRYVFIGSLVRPQNGPTFGISSGFWQEPGKWVQEIDHHLFAEWRNGNNVVLLKR